MTQADPRVLVLGRSAAVNQRVVAQLQARGHAAVGGVDDGEFPGLDVRDFEVVAIGSGVDAATRAELGRRCTQQRADVLLLDVYAPLATEQIEGALRRAEDGPGSFESLTIEDVGEWRLVRVGVRRPCRLQVAVYRPRDAPEPEVVPVAGVRVVAGTHLFAVAAAFTGERHMLVVRCDDELEVRPLPGA